MVCAESKRDGASSRRQKEENGSCFECFDKGDVILKVINSCEVVVRTNSGNIVYSLGDLGMLVWPVHAWVECRCIMHT